MPDRGRHDRSQNAPRNVLRIGRLLPRWHWRSAPTITFSARASHPNPPISNHRLELPRGLLVVMRRHLLAGVAGCHLSRYWHHVHIRAFLVPPTSATGVSSSSSRRLRLAISSNAVECVLHQRAHSCLKLLCTGATPREAWRCSGEGSSRMLTCFICCQIAT